MKRMGLKWWPALLLSSLSWASVPANFTDQLVVSVGNPTSLAFTPDGRVVVTRQSGEVRIIQNDVLLGTAALSLSASILCSNFERGLLGVAIDPDFTNNHYIYLYYTFKKFGTCPTNDPTNVNNPVNRVSRFVLPDTNIINPSTETILIDNIRSPNGNHNGGDLQFGKDGNLYISIGDGGADYAGNSGSGGANDASRDKHELLGKVLRITRDGDIPADNPFQGTGTGRCNANGETTPGNHCQETFVWGLRNPFRLAMDSNALSTRLFIDDVGQNSWEEIDIAQSGGDYGWNCREGTHTNSTTGPCSPTPPNLIPPIFEYPHSGNVPGTTVSGCASITGAAFVPNGLWPAAYDNSYLFADYICGAIFKLTDNGASWTASEFATGLGSGSAVHMVFGPRPGGASDALYYTTYAGGGQIRRIYYGAASTPTPTRTRTPTTTPTFSPTTTETRTPTITETPSPTQTATNTPTETASATSTETPTQTETVNPSFTVTETATETQTPEASATPTETQTPEASATPTETQTPEASATPTETQTPPPPPTTNALAPSGAGLLCLLLLALVSLRLRKANP